MSLLTRGSGSPAERTVSRGATNHTKTLRPADSFATGQQLPLSANILHKASQMPDLNGLIDPTLGIKLNNARPSMTTARFSI